MLLPEEMLTEATEATADDDDGILLLFGDRVLIGDITEFCRICSSYLFSSYNKKE